MKAANIVQLIAFPISLFCLMSCEGFKFITIENKSKGNVTIVAHPGIEAPELVEKPKTYRNRIDTILALPPDSTLKIPVYFGPVNWFDKKVKEENTKFNFFKIISKNDTIIANNKKELHKQLKRKGNIGSITIK